MALPVWGPLEKSQVDPEKIEEAIARLIQAHEDDSDAHVETGESLHSHKAAEIIDHLVASIIADKIKDWEVIKLGGDFDRTDFHWWTHFESLDGFSQLIANSGVVSLENFYVQLSTGVVVNSRAGIADTLLISDVYTWNVRRKFRTRIHFSSNTDQVILFYTGIMDVAEEQRHMGFRIANGAVYGDVANGTNRTLLDLNFNITPGTAHNFELRFYPGEKVEYYINGVLKGTTTINLPSGITDAYGIIVAEVKNTAAANKYIRFSYWDFWQST